MITDQHPCDSGFTAAATVDDVLQGVDLTDQHIIVTGGHSRLGREVSRALIAAGGSVTVAARNPERAAAALCGLDGVRIEPLDLTDPTSIDAFLNDGLPPVGRCTHS